MRDGDRVVHHYPVTAEGETHLVPASAKVVSAVMRQGRPHVYIEHWGGEPELRLKVFFVGTGQPFVSLTPCDHVATLNDGAFVWHVYAGIDRG